MQARQFSVCISIGNASTNRVGIRCCRVAGGVGVGGGGGDRLSAEETVKGWGTRNEIPGLTWPPLRTSVPHPDTGQMASKCP